MPEIEGRDWPPHSLDDAARSLSPAHQHTTHTTAVVNAQSTGASNYVSGTRASLLGVALCAAACLNSSGLLVAPPSLHVVLLLSRQSALFFLLSLLHLTAAFVLSPLTSPPLSRIAMSTPAGGGAPGPGGGALAAPHGAADYTPDALALEEPLLASVQMEDNLLLFSPPLPHSSSRTEPRTPEARHTDSGSLGASPSVSAFGSPLGRRAGGSELLPSSQADAHMEEEQQHENTLLPPSADVVQSWCFSRGADGRANFQVVLEALDMILQGPEAAQRHFEATHVLPCTAAELGPLSSETYHFNRRTGNSLSAFPPVPSSSQPLFSRRLGTTTFQFAPLAVFLSVTAEDPAEQARYMCAQLASVEWLEFVVTFLEDVPDDQRMQNSRLIDLWMLRIVELWRLAPHASAEYLRPPANPEAAKPQRTLSVASSGVQVSSAPPPQITMDFAAAQNKLQQVLSLPLPDANHVHSMTPMSPAEARTMRQAEASSSAFQTVCRFLLPEDECCEPALLKSMQATLQDAQWFAAFEQHLSSSHSAFSIGRIFDLCFMRITQSRLESGTHYAQTCAKLRANEPGIPARSMQPGEVSQFLSAACSLRLVRSLGGDRLEEPPALEPQGIPSKLARFYRAQMHPISFFLLSKELVGGVYFAQFMRAQLLSRSWFQWAEGFVARISLPMERLVELWRSRISAVSAIKLPAPSVLAGAAAATAMLPATATKVKAVLTRAQTGAISSRGFGAPESPSARSSFSRGCEDTARTEALAHDEDEEMAETCYLVLGSCFPSAQFCEELKASHPELAKIFEGLRFFWLAHERQMQCRLFTVDAGVHARQCEPGRHLQPKESGVFTVEDAQALRQLAGRGVQFTEILVVDMVTTFEYSTGSSALSVGQGAFFYDPRNWHVVLTHLAGVGLVNATTELQLPNSSLLVERFEPIAQSYRGAAGQVYYPVIYDSSNDVIVALRSKRMPPCNGRTMISHLMSARPAGLKLLVPEPTARVILLEDSLLNAAQVAAAADAFKARWKSLESLTPLLKLDDILKRYLTEEPLRQALTPPWMLQYVKTVQLPSPMDRQPRVQLRVSNSSVVGAPLSFGLFASVAVLHRDPICYFGGFLKKQVGGRLPPLARALSNGFMLDGTAVASGLLNFVPSNETQLQFLMGLPAHSWELMCHATIIPEPVAEDLSRCGMGFMARECAPGEVPNAKLVEMAIGGNALLLLEAVKHVEPGEQILVQSSAIQPPAIASSVASVGPAASGVTQGAGPKKEPEVMPPASEQATKLEKARLEDSAKVEEMEQKATVAAVKIENLNSSLSQAADEKTVNDTLELKPMGNLSETKLGPTLERLKNLEAGIKKTLAEKHLPATDFDAAYNLVEYVEELGKYAASRKRIQRPGFTVWQDPDQGGPPPARTGNIFFLLDFDNYKRNPRAFVPLIPVRYHVVVGDGNCAFRACMIAAFPEGHVTVQRNAFGFPVSEEREKDEKNLSDSLRTAYVTLIAERGCAVMEVFVVLCGN